MPKNAKISKKRRTEVISGQHDSIFVDNTEDGSTSDIRSAKQSQQTRK